MSGNLYLGYDNKTKRKLFIYKENILEKTLSEMTPDAECYIDDWNSSFWMKFIKDVTKNKFPNLFITKCPIRIFTDNISDQEKSISSELDMFEFLNKNNLVSSSIIWETNAGLIGTYTTGDLITLTIKATDYQNKTLSYSIKSGSLPLGITLSNNGILSGIIRNDTYLDTYDFYIEVTNGDTSISRKFSLVIQNLGPVWSTEAGLLLTTSVGSKIDINLIANDPENKSIEYDIEYGFLPLGIQLDTSGRILGYANVAGIYNFVVTASDGLNISHRSFSIIVE